MKCRKAKNCKGKILAKEPEKIKLCSVILTKEQMIKCYDEEEDLFGLQKRFNHIGSYELTWCEVENNILCIIFKKKQTMLVCSLEE